MEHIALNLRPSPSSPDDHQYADLQYRRRLSTLLSVDDMVRRLVATLTRAGRLNSTFIFYSSDNGACVRACVTIRVPMFELYPLLSIA